MFLIIFCTFEKITMKIEILPFKVPPLVNFKSETSIPQKANRKISK